jgi:hypothetical protein
MSPQPKSDNKWYVGIIVAVGLAALGLSMQMGRYQNKVDDLLEARRSQAVIDAAQDGRIGGIENRTTAIETDVEAIKAGRYNGVIERLPNTPAFGPPR